MFSVAATVSSVMLASTVEQSCPILLAQELGIVSIKSGVYPFSGIQSAGLLKLEHQVTWHPVQLAMAKICYLLFAIDHRW